MREAHIEDSLFKLVKLMTFLSIIKKHNDSKCAPGIGESVSYISSDHDTDLNSSYLERINLAN